MASSRQKSNNRFWALEGLDSGGEGEQAADAGSNDIHHLESQLDRHIRRRMMKVADADRPLRETSKSLNRSSRRFHIDLQEAVTKRPLATLCSICESIFILERSEEWFGVWHDHHQSEFALHQAATRGCSICKLIQQNYTVKGLHIDPEILVFRPEKKLGPLKYKVELDSVNFGGTGYGVLELVMYEPKDIEPKLSNLVPSFTTSSDQPWDLCRYWLHTCRSKHYFCGPRHTAPTFRPTRLICIEGMDDGIIQARLDCRTVTSKGLSYTTLSHCWGTAKFFTLQRRNLDMLRARIPVGDLSRVFQDALFRILKLGFSYIWIDSLCIVQDSEDDWLRESSLMGDIYKHSACNIAATGFSEGSHGLFVERDLNSTVCPKVYAKWKGNWMHTNKPRRGMYYLVDQTLWDTQVSAAPLNKRGWVMQERLLSPCILHFGGRQLFWECFELHSSKTFPCGFPVGFVTSAFFKSMLFLGDTAAQHPSRMNSFQHQDYQDHQIKSASSHIMPWLSYRSWHEAVKAYSVGQLTRAEDKLLAISGAAKEAQHVLKDRYLAGLWERNFMMDLLWTVHHNESAVGLTTKYRAPTWSWASLNAVIDYQFAYRLGFQEEMIVAELINAQLTYATQDDTGLVIGGRVRIQGRPSVIKLTGGTWWQDEAIINGIQIELSVYFDFLNRYQEVERSSGFALKQEIDGVSEIFTSQAFQRKLSRSQPLYILPIRRGIRESTGELEITGQLLARTGSRRGQYIRIGLLVAETRGAQQAIMAPSPPLAPDLGEEDTGHDQYVISIL